MAHLNLEFVRESERWSCGAVGGHAVPRLCIFLSCS